NDVPPPAQPEVTGYTTPPGPQQQPDSDTLSSPPLPAAHPTSVATAPPSPPAAGLPPVPGYEGLGLLGAGGMGVVYRARQIRANRLVALKVVKAGVDATNEELARFRTEAEAIARLTHPNIVQVYEVGEHDGRPFFSLEFCPGGSLG